MSQMGENFIGAMILTSKAVQKVADTVGTREAIMRHGPTTNDVLARDFTSASKVSVESSKGRNINTTA